METKGLKDWLWAATGQWGSLSRIYSTLYCEKQEKITVKAEIIAQQNISALRSILLIKTAYSVVECVISLLA